MGRNMIYVPAFLVFLYITSVHSDYSFETKYAEVPIDHFSYTKTDTFKIRYLLNDSFWKESGPLFFYTGNEGSIDLFASNSGFIMDLAPKFKALIVFCEHRYYGTSLPFGNLSLTAPQYSGYLTSEQALRDFVHVIDEIQNSKYGEDYPLPVIAFGGSYGGMLAAWIRIKYPSSVLGAIAASAPVWQFPNLTDCGVFNSIVTDVYAAASKDCTIPIKKLWPAIRSVTNTADGRAWLTSTWKLCHKLSNASDVDTLIDDIVNALVNVAMANYPYPNNFLAELPAYPVAAICSALRNYEASLKDDKKLISFVGQALSIYTNYTGKALCTTFDATSSLDIAGWNIQSCTQMVMPMCSEKEHMFEISSWNFTKYSQDCIKNYGLKPNEKSIALEYGGKNIKAASNIVFSNGLLDPWSGGGVLSNLSDTVSAVVIPEGAHHLDLRAANEKDPESVVKARKFHEDSIRAWISRFWSNTETAHVLQVKK